MHIAVLGAKHRIWRGRGIFPHASVVKGADVSVPARASLANSTARVKVKSAGNGGLPRTEQGASQTAVLRANIVRSAAASPRKPLRRASSTNEQAPMRCKLPLTAQGVSRKAFPCASVAKGAGVSVPICKAFQGAQPLLRTNHCAGRKYKCASPNAMQTTTNGARRFANSVSVGEYGEGCGRECSCTRFPRE